MSNYAKNLYSEKKNISNQLKELEKELNTNKFLTKNIHYRLSKKKLKEVLLKKLIKVNTEINHIEQFAFTFGNP